MQQLKALNGPFSVCVRIKATAVIFMMVFNLQACGGVESNVESSSLHPTPADLKKDWIDDGAAATGAIGKDTKP
jgi:hypothetical protein